MIKQGMFATGIFFFCLLFLISADSADSPDLDEDCDDGACYADGVMAEISNDGENTILTLSFTEDDTLSLDAQLSFEHGAFNASYENLKPWMCAYNPENGKIACADAHGVGAGEFGRYVITSIGEHGVYELSLIVSYRGASAGNLMVNERLSFWIEIPRRRNLPINYVPNAPYLDADWNDNGEVLLRWSRSDLIKEEITGRLVLNRLSKRLEANQITGNAGFIDSITGFFKTLFGAESVGANINYDKTVYGIYRNGMRINEVVDDECLMENCAYTDIVDTGTYEYYVEACYGDNCRESNHVVAEVAAQGQYAGDLPEIEEPAGDIGDGITTTTMLRAGKPAVGNDGINETTTTTIGSGASKPATGASLCSSSPDGVCPGGCAVLIMIVAGLLENAGFIAG